MSRLGFIALEQCARYRFILSLSNTALTDSNTGAHMYHAIAVAFFFFHFLLLSDALLWVPCKPFWEYGELYICGAVFGRTV